MGCCTLDDLSDCHVQFADVDCSCASETQGESLPADPTVSSHVELENKRLKEVTDAILYELLPAAIATVTHEVDNVPQELTWDLCQVRSRMKCTSPALCLLLTFTSPVQHVAGAVLIVACLLNATPSFLEFLLCIPWRHLGELYPRQVQPNMLDLMQSFSTP